MKQLRKDYLLLAVFLSNIFYTVGYPVIQQLTMQGIEDARLISLNALIGCSSGVIVGKIWNKYKKKLIKLFPVFAIGDIVTYAVLCLAFWITKDAQMYYIAQVLIACMTIKNVCFGLNTIKSIRYKKEQREEFDNNEAILGNAASMIGFGLGSLIPIPVKIGFILMLIGTIIENALYCKVYKETIK